MWLLYASELAAAIGQNKYKKKWEVLLNVFKRLNHGELFEAAVKRLEKQGIRLIDDDVRMDDVIKQTGIQDHVEQLLSAPVAASSSALHSNVEQFRVGLVEVEEKLQQRKEVLQEEVKKSATEIKALKETEQEVKVQLAQVNDQVLETTVQLHSANDPMKAQMLQKSLEKLQTEQHQLQTEKAEIADQEVRLEAEVKQITTELTQHNQVWNDLKMTKKNVISQVSTAYGTKKEDEQIENKTMGEIEANNSKFYKKALGTKPVRWGIGGRIDGLRQGQLIEIKNRRSRIFDSVPEYEYIQLQAYMQMLNLPTATLIQCLTMDFDEIERQETLVHRNDRYWNDFVLQELNLFIRVLNDLAHDTKLQNKFFSAADNKKSYVVTPLFTRYRKKLGIPKVPKTAERRLLMASAEVMLAKKARTQKRKCPEGQTTLSFAKKSKVSGSGGSGEKKKAMTHAKPATPANPAQPAQPGSFFDDPDEPDRAPMDFTRSLTTYLPADWQQLMQDEFKKPYWGKLITWADQQYQTMTIYPPREQVFTALNLCPVDKVSVVVLGQDPYINPGQAEGLCFSVVKGIKHPPSLRNILQEIQRDMGHTYNKKGSGSLRKWAEQGVLLLNVTLTVYAGKSNSHYKSDWKRFTDQLIRNVSAHHPNIVFLLWGKDAQAKIPLIQNPGNHYILTTSHPSPLSASRGFKGCGHFSLTNTYLESNRRVGINWSLE